MADENVQGEGLQESSESANVAEEGGGEEPFTPELDASEAVPWDEFIAEQTEGVEDATAESGEAKPDDAEEATESVEATKAEQDKAEPDKGEATPESAPTADTRKQYPAFSYKGDGEEYTVPGSVRRDEGVFIPANQVDWLQQQLATARAHHGSWRRELAAARQEGEDLKGEAEAIKKGADLITSRLQELAEGPEEAFIEWAQNYRRNLPTLLAEARAETAEARSKALEERSQRGAAAEQQQEMAAQIERGIDALVENYAPSYPGVPKDKIRARLGRVKNSLFYPAPEDDPMGRWKKGEIVVDYGLVEDEFSHAQTLMGATAKPAQQAAKANAEAVKEAKAPPVTGAKSTVSRPTRPKAKQFKTEQEFREYVDSGEAARDIQRQLEAAREGS